MGRTCDLTDDGSVVIIGSGAGGGTLAKELGLRGVTALCSRRASISRLLISRTMSGRCLTRSHG
jgi:NADH dehydrogenase FAD-containing subunit